MNPDTGAEAGNAFARRFRLTKTDEFSSVFGFKRAIRGQFFMLHYRPRDNGGGEARLGLVVGKKLIKSAVRRNLVKRLVREQFRQRRAELPACDLVVRLMAKPGRIDRRSVAEEVVGLFARLPRRFAPTDVQ